MMKVEAVGLPTKVGDLAQARMGGSAGSDDIAEVSWNVPTVVLRYPGNIPGMVGHHWSSGISMATPIAHKGATAGAKAHVQTVLDLLLNPKLLADAKQYFADMTKETRWKSLIPVDTKPPIQFNREKMERFRPQLDKLVYDPARHRTYLEQLGITYPTVE
jgi:aminobenzoyl-glutamate utilization protein B